MTLSAGAYVEKNKMSTSNVWLVLLDITVPGLADPLKIVSNSENVWWPGTTSAENLYTAIPFDLGEIGDDSKGEVPSVSLRVANTARWCESYLDDYNGMIDSNVEIRIVNSINVLTPTKGSCTYLDVPELLLYYDIVASSSDSMWGAFTLGASNPFNKRFPRNKIYRNICRYRWFKGVRCAYPGTATICNRSLDQCRNDRDNSSRFGGCPGVASKGVFI